MIKRSLFLLPLMLAAGCSMPGPVQFAAWVSDGISLLTTRKSVPDHVISFAVRKDCASWQALAGGRLCNDKTAGVMMAAAGNAQTSPASPGSGVLPEDDIQEIAGFATASGGGTMIPSHEPAAAPSSTKRLIAKRDVNMRNKPAGNSMVLTTIANGQEVHFIGERRGWRLVEYRASRPERTITGWIDGSYLKSQG